jgi:hypothetical protein
VTDILNQFRDEELPPSTVDVRRAVLAGRKRRRVRTLIVICGVVVAVAAGAVTVPLLVSARPNPGPVTPNDPDCGSPTPARPAQQTWQRFDPLLAEIDASGVVGFHITTAATSTHWQHVELDNGDNRVLVVLFACGGQPPLIDAEGKAVPLEPAEGEPADPVGGTPAYWIRQPGTIGGLALAWQWTRGAWAMVMDGSPSRTLDGAQALVTQVAPQLRFGAGAPVRSPFSMPAPAGMYPALTVRQQARDNGQDSPVSFGIGFNTVGKDEPTHPFGREYVNSLSIGANSFAKLEDLPDGATEYTEDLGYPAYRAVTQAGDQQTEALMVFDFFGFGISISPVEVPGTATEKLRAAADVFRTVTVYPGAATDLAAWGDPLAP